MGRLVKIAFFEHPWQAYVAQGRLEAEGIKSFVFDDGIVYANPGLTNAVGGVKLMVHRDDGDRALSILRERVSEDETSEMD